MSPPAPPARSPLLRLLAGPALGGAAGALAAAVGLEAPAAITAAVTTWTAAWWVLEPLPLAATSLLPFALLPFLGVLDEKEVSAAYGHPLVLLMLGGFMLSTAMAASGAHRRLALGMVRLIGGGRRRVVLGFLVATALISMWISNTATVLMMLPVALAVVEQDPAPEVLAPPLLAGLAWGASIGGLGTPVGTPPNVIFMGVYEELTGHAVGFLDWMAFGVPAVLALLPVAWAILAWRLPEGPGLDLPPAGPLRPHELRVGLVFGATALAWVTRTDPFGGWAGQLGLEDVGDSTVAFLALVLLFVLPAGEADRGGDPRAVPGRLLTWAEARQVPWGLLLLFGGGIAIARAFEVTGLGAALGEGLGRMTGLPPLALAFVLCAGVIFLTEVTSNTALATLLMPVTAAAAQGAGLEPAVLMVPACLAASCGFMMPAGTAPNAIVFGTERVPIRFMVRRGLGLNLASAIVLAVLCTWMLGDGVP